MRPRTRLQQVTRWNEAGAASRDQVVLEEPLQIHLASATRSLRLGTTLRTPGHDYELVFGYLFSLGIIASRAEVSEISYCSSPQDYNRVSVTFRGDIPSRALDLRNQAWTHGGCGACGQDELQVLPPHRVEALAWPPPTAWLCGLPRQLRSRQALFEQCGGTHAAALVRPGGSIEQVFEDVGRHNAVDKLVGELLMQDRLPAAGCWLLLSGRSGFELVQKAVAAGFSAVASVGPPSSLAIRYAEQAGLVLVGFLAEERYNRYTTSEDSRP